MNKILSYQPFSLYGNGGSSRIFRRLYGEKIDQVFSLGLGYARENCVDIKNQEKIIPLTPIHRPIYRSVLRQIMSFVRGNIFYPLTKKRIVAAAEKIEWTILHTHAHGPFADALADLADVRNAAHWVSFHDHYESIKMPRYQCDKLWRKADRRFVISKEMGLLYAKEFGDLPWSILTDGLLDSEIEQVKKTSPGSITVYFAGLLHIGYYDLFRVLVHSLMDFKKLGVDVKLILRGTQKLEFLKDIEFKIEYRPFCIDDAVLLKERNEADVLYLPLMFNNPNFYRYSLSTKMIGYLGAPGTILYHGPADSCLARMLAEAGAAVLCTSCDSKAMHSSIENIIRSGESIAYSAKDLARREFMLKEKRAAFWNL